MVDYRKLTDGKNKGRKATGKVRNIQKSTNRELSCVSGCEGLAYFLYNI